MIAAPHLVPAGRRRRRARHPGFGAQDRGPAPGGLPPPVAAVFAFVYRLLVHRWRTDAAGQVAASAVRARRPGQPAAGLDDPHDGRLHLVFWGTGGAHRSRAFEISGSSLTTMGFAEPNGTGRIWIAFVEAMIGLGLVALLISYLPTIYLRLQRAGEGHQPPAAGRRLAAHAPRSSPAAAAHRDARQPRVLEEPGRLDARPGADPHRLPDPLLLPRDPTPTTRGSPPSGRCSTPPHWSSPRPRRQRARSSLTSRRGR